MKKSGFFVVLLAIICSSIAIYGCAKTEKTEAQLWDATEWTTWGEFDFDGLNATPMKEIAIEGYEYVEVKAEYSAKDDIYMMLELYYEEDESWPRARLNPPSKEGEIIVKAPVKKGSRFQILTQAFQKDCSYNGDYVVDKVKLSYRLTN